MSCTLDHTAPAAATLSTLAFWISFPVTLLLLGVALFTGLTHRRRAHLVCGPVALVSLGIAIVFAVLMGKLRVFPPQEMRLHRMIATTAGLLAILVAVTGIWLYYSPRMRKVHKALVLVFIVAALGASGTGIWVFTLSTPR